MTHTPIILVDAFTPFSAEEVRRLERYAARAGKLAACPFMQRTETSWSLSVSEGQPMTSTFGGIDEAELHQALMLLRPLYLQSEEAGFSKVQAMLKRHAHARGTEQGKLATAAVKQATTDLRDILKNPELLQFREQRVDAAGTVVHAEDVTPARIFDDFLNGVVFHEDEERIERIGTWLPADIQRYIFVRTVTRMADVYVGFRGAADAILSEPALRAQAK